MPACRLTVGMDHANKIFCLSSYILPLPPVILIRMFTINVAIRISVDATRNKFDRSVAANLNHSNIRQQPLTLKLIILLGGKFLNVITDL